MKAAKKTPKNPKNESFLGRVNIEDFLGLLIACVCVCTFHMRVLVCAHTRVYVYVQVKMPGHTRGGQRTICWRRFSLSTI